MDDIVLTKSPGMGGLLWKAARSSGGPLEPGESAPNLAVRIEGATFDREKLEAYRRVCGLPDTGHLPIAAPHLLAAPLHLVLLTDPLCPFKAMGLIHVENRIHVERPLPENAELDIRVAIGATRWMANGVEVTVESTASMAGECVWKESSVIFSRQKKTVDNAPRRESGNVWWEDSQRSDWALDANLGRKYASVSGDWNPIHLWGATAKLFGFKRAIIHGMWTLGRTLAEFEQEVGDGPVDFDLQFHRPIFLPGKASFVRQSEEGPSSFAVIRPKDGKAHLVGSCSF